MSHETWKEVEKDIINSRIDYRIKSLFQSSTGTTHLENQISDAEVSCRTGHGR